MPNFHKVTVLFYPGATYHRIRAWNQVNKETINRFEVAQRRAARFATGDYQHTSSVTSMLQQLQWQSLQTRRERTQVVMLYRKVYRLVDIPSESYLQPTSLRTRGHTLRFLVPHIRTTVYKTFLFPLLSQVLGSLIVIIILNLRQSYIKPAAVE